MGWSIVIAIIAVLSLAGLILFRWFRAYRYTESWRKGELRGATLGLLVWIGGFFGYRLPPPPQSNVRRQGLLTSAPAAPAGRCRRRRLGWPDAPPAGA